MVFPVISGKHSSDRFDNPTVAKVDENVIGGMGIPPTGDNIELPSNVTAPVRAIARPVRDAPVPKETDDSAMISPTITALVPIVAEAPTCQTTLAATAPLIRTTLAPTLMVSAEPTWKINCAFGLP
jgi:hypothetical protein